MNEYMLDEDAIYDYADTSTNGVVIVTEHSARILSGGADIVLARRTTDGSFSLTQEGDAIHMSADMADALFLVLDTMLHPDEQ
jgi:hypothetical protein